MFLFTTLKLFSCSFWVLYFQTRRHELVTGHHLSRILDSEMFPKICVYYWLNFNYVIVWYVMTYLSIISEPALYSKIYVAYEIKRRCNQGYLWRFNLETRNIPNIQQPRTQTLWRRTITSFETKNLYLKSMLNFWQNISTIKSSLSVANSKFSWPFDRMVARYGYSTNYFR